MQDLPVKEIPSQEAGANTDERPERLAPEPQPVTRQIRSSGSKPNRAKISKIGDSRVQTSRKKPNARKSAALGQRTSKQPRLQRSFPASSLEDALELGNTMQRMGSQRVRRLTLFEELGRSAESGPSRQLIINSGRYGITTGGIRAEWLELTEQGKLATSPEGPRRQQVRARFELGIQLVEPFKALYDEFSGKRLPSSSVLRDFLREKGFQEAGFQECIDTFTINAKFVGVLRTIAGAERLLPIDHALDDLPSPSKSADVLESPLSVTKGDSIREHEVPDWSRVCFYVTGIGDEDSEIRKHSDLFLGSIIEPALGDFDLKVVRADQIGDPGMITAQVIEHVVNARIVIADLSFHNPNVFYEVALRHAVRKPIVQLIRALDRIPFDLDQFRTIRIDTTDVYSLVPQIETHRSEIANQVRRALEGTSIIENPLTIFFPTFWDSFTQMTEVHLLDQTVATPDVSGDDRSIVKSNTQDSM